MAPTYSSEKIEFDHALLMRDAFHEWHSEPEMLADKRINSKPDSGGNA
jgi:hypothetical protein